MSYTAIVQYIIAGDAVRWHLLDVVRSLRLPDCWVGAGFVRNAVWDALHGRTASSLCGDVDVVWFDADCTDPLADREIEEVLRRLEPSVVWSVKNQARMHTRNGDAAYASVHEAMQFWPETATGVAVRRSERDDCEVSAPFGLEDLFGLVVKPTPRFAGEKRQVFEERVQAKGWLERWPLLRVAEAADRSCDCGEEIASSLRSSQ